MPGSSNNASFIPKRGPVPQSGRSSKRQVYVGTFIVRIIFFAALLATAGVYFYESRLEAALAREVVELDKAVASFNVAEMQRVVTAEQRLKQANQVFSQAASVSTLLTALERAMAQNSQITQFNLTREGADVYELTADLKTPSFDAVMFQRELLAGSGVFSVNEITDLTIQSSSVDPSGRTISSNEQNISFKAVLGIDVAKIPHQLADVPFTDNQNMPAPSDTTETVSDPALDAAESFVDDGDYSDTNNNEI
jgi:hypothetical protein